MIVTRSIESPELMEHFAATIAAALQGGECIELQSDLGGGKTTFTRGLVRGLGSNAVVASPTFTIGKQYDSPKFKVYHYDFYRLPEPGLVAEELAEALEDPSAIIVVEWAATVSDVLPEDRLMLQIERVAAHEEHRSVTVHIPASFEHIAKVLDI